MAEVTAKANELAELSAQWEGKSPADIITAAWQKLPGSKVLAISTQLEEVVILDMILKAGLEVRAYTLDTGRLHPETYRMMDNIKFKYDIDFEVYYPDASALQELTTQKGQYSFKESLENRKECCGIRKVEPNQRALKGADVWITGLRRDHSPERADTPIVEEDGGLVKLSPLAASSWDELLAYAKDNKVPIHPLYEKGYPSIGCEPCTRAVEPGEDSRAGRWWWELPGQKECGLHMPGSK